MQNLNIHVELYWISTNPFNSNNNWWTAKATEIENEFLSVIVDILSDKLAPSRNINHIIQLKSGSTPIACRPHRMHVSDKKDLES